MKFVIPIENQLAYNAMPRNRHTKLEITNTCNTPSRMLLIDYKGDCFVCGCEAWLPIPIGKITDFEKLEDAWNSPVAKILQDDIDKKLFSDCAVDRCGILHYDQILPHYVVSINIDESCNLACPSCRPQAKMLTQGPEHELKLSRVNHILKLLENFEPRVHVVMSGNGDVLASSIMRPLIHKWRPKQNQTLRLFTNGLLLKKQLTDSPVVSHITQYFISIDAGSAPVYENVRRPGKWANLIENLDFLRETVDRTGANVLLKFVFQKANWQDLENFAKLCNHYKFKGDVARLEDWASFGKEFDQHNVLDPKHPDYHHAIAELKRVNDLYSPTEEFWVDPGIIL